MGFDGGIVCFVENKINMDSSLGLGLLPLSLYKFWYILLVSKIRAAYYKEYILIDFQKLG